VETVANDFAMSVATGMYGESLEGKSFEKLRGSDGVLEGASFFRRMASSFSRDLI
jgi:hypothetical protein